MPTHVITKANNLHVLYEPDTGFWYVFWIIATILFFWLFFGNQLLTWVVLAALLLMPVAIVISEVTTRCVFNLTDQSILFERGGILGLKLLRLEERYDLTDLDAIRVRRLSTDDTELFMIQLVIKNKRPEPVISGYLNDEEYRRLLVQIKEFVHPDTPIVLVTGV